MYQVLLAMDLKFKVLTLLTPNPWITFIVSLSKIFWKKKKNPIIYIWSFSTYKEKKESAQTLQYSTGGPYLVIGLVHTKDILAPVLVC